MLLYLFMRAAIRLHNLLQHTPTNLLLRWLRSRRGLKWGIPFILVGATYVLAGASLATWLQHGGPGWLNLLIALGAWNAMKLILTGPISVVLLIAAHVREYRDVRRDSSGMSEDRDMIRHAVR